MTTAEQNRGAISLPLAFLSIAGFWLIYAIVNTARAAVMGFPAQDELMWRRLAVTLVGIVLTFCFCLLLRLFDRRPFGQRITAAFIGAAPTAILMSLFNYWLFNVYDAERIFASSPDVGIAQPMSMVQTLAELALNRYFFLPPGACCFWRSATRARCAPPNAKRRDCREPRTTPKCARYAIR